jgi:hypothetical protein
MYVPLAITASSHGVVVAQGTFDPTASICWNPGGTTASPVTTDRPLISMVDPHCPCYLQAPQVINVFWPGPNGPVQTLVTTLMPDFLNDLFASQQWQTVLPQYVGALAPSVSTASVTLVKLLTMAMSNTVYAATISSELYAQITAGALPPPLPSGDTYYVVHFPPLVTIVDQDSPGHVSIGTSCVQWCAYHDFYTNVTNNPATGAPTFFTFSVHPDMSQSPGCLAGCGVGDMIEIYTQVVSHEVTETVTDPYNAGWKNACPVGAEEIVDVCAFTNFLFPRQLYVGGTPEQRTWGYQSTFSNAAFVNDAGGCIVTGAAPPCNNATNCVNGGTCTDLYHCQCGTGWTYVFFDGGNWCATKLLFPIAGA